MSDVLPASPYPLPSEITPDIVLDRIVRLTPDVRLHRLLSQAWGAGEFRWEDISAGPLSAVGQTIRELSRLDPPRAFFRQSPSLSEARRFVAERSAVEPDTDQSPSARQDLLLDRAKARLESLTVTLPSGLEVTIPMTQFAAIFRSQGTKWCTGSWFDNAFDEYAADGALLILKTPDGQLFQTDLPSLGFENMLLGNDPTIMNALDSKPSAQEWRNLLPHIPDLIDFAVRAQDHDLTETRSFLTGWSQAELGRHAAPDHEITQIPDPGMTSDHDILSPPSVRRPDEGRPLYIVVRMEDLATSRRDLGLTTRDGDPRAVVTVIDLHLHDILASRSRLAIEGLFGNVPYNLPAIEAIVRVACADSPLKASIDLTLMPDVFDAIVAAWRSGDMRTLPPPVMDGALADQVARYVVAVAFAKAILCGDRNRDAMPMVRSLDAWVQSGDAKPGTDRRLDALMQDYAFLTAGLDRKTLRRLPRDERLVFEIFSTTYPDRFGGWTAPQNRREASICRDTAAMRAAGLTPGEQMSMAVVASLSSAIPFPSTEDVAILEHLSTSWRDGTMTRDDALSVVSYVASRSEIQHAAASSLATARAAADVLSPFLEEDAPFLLAEDDSYDAGSDEIEENATSDRLSGCGYLVDFIANTRIVAETAHLAKARIAYATHQIESAFPTQRLSRQAALKL